jgi:F-type H+-transporting ATPase subunit a
MSDHENSSKEHSAQGSASHGTEDHAPAHVGNPLAPEHLFGHVQDSTEFHVPYRLGSHWIIPQPFPHYRETPLVAAKPALHLAPIDLQVTKFMVLEVVAALVMVVLFVPLARRVTDGSRPRGRIANLLEAFLVFLRDQVARPAIGGHDADKYLPFLWTMFFFVLGCNLLGLLPWLGSPTAALAVTGTLALMTFLVVVGSGMAKMGVIGFWKGLVPHMELPWILAIFLLPMIFAIELLGLVIKHGILAIRLLANMVAGHLVLAVLVAFILASNRTLAWYGVAPASVLGSSALMLLELFVAFLQAYIFTFLSALFIGMAVHPH